MRLVTKAILLLSLVAVGVVVLCLAGRRDGLRSDRQTRPRVEPSDSGSRVLQDPLADYERWRNRLAQENRNPAGGHPESVGQGATGRPPAHDLESSAQDEGTVIALQTQHPVVGADPPGPTLKPEGAEGIVVQGRWLPQDEDAGRVHVIRPGDTLFEIARERYGDASFVRLIEAANPGVNALALKIGDRLVLPEKPKPQEAEVAPTPSQTKVYVVQKNDTLIGIARRFYGDAAMYRKIYEANRDVLSSLNATLYVGQTLRLPEPR
jgi:nucleoid-associated protein YgaU